MPSSFLFIFFFFAKFVHFDNIYKQKYKNHQQIFPFFFSFSLLFFSSNFGLICPMVCLLVAGPGGHLPPLFDHQSAAFHHHHLHGSGNGGNHHAMSYHNMFTPARDPGTMWRCRSCGKEVTNRWHHYHSHTAQRSLCPYCPATYSRIDTLRSHLRAKHSHQLTKP